MADELPHGRSDRRRRLRRHRARALPAARSYLGTARAPKQRHHAYERSPLRRVNGAVIHCVAGDGLGIMTAMVIARALGFAFWPEFWFEYAVGFAFGWFVFQLRSMKA